MTENATPTLAPEKEVVSSPEAPEAKTPESSLENEKKALFDSIAEESHAPYGESQTTRLGAFFTGLLWFGYAIAIGVSLILVWTAVSSLLKSFH